MRIFVPRESYEGENRVATTPSVVRELKKLGYEISIEEEAGKAANFSDISFIDAGASIVPTSVSSWQEADVILKVRGPGFNSALNREEIELLSEGQTLISFLWPAQNEDVVKVAERKKINLIAMDCVPRISRAQKMDALSSMANIGGYRAIVEAAGQFGRFFTGQITAAGKIPPAKVLIIGAGVAGLAAIGAAKSMGAIVRAFDTRPEVKEQVESMDAEFLMLEFEEEGGGAGGYAKVMSEEFIKAEMELFAEQARDVDIIVTTALIPGKPAPKLITEEMVHSMRDGSVIVDLAAEQGGNCELTKPGEICKSKGVTIIGFTDLPSRLATQSSQLFATNLRHLISDMTPEKEGQLQFDLEDEVVRGSTVVHKGKIIWPAPPPKLSAAPKKKIEAPVVVPKEQPRNPWAQLITLSLGAVVLWGIGRVAPEAFMSHLTVFVLACFVGYQVIWNVTPALHTPLMSVTNAISGIIIIGAILQISSSSTITIILASVSVLIATINIAGGFLVTRRMLEMFRK